jgi:hypothetical protein
MDKVPAVSIFKINAPCCVDEAPGALFSCPLKSVPTLTPRARTRPHTFAKVIERLPRARNHNRCDLARNTAIPKESDQNLSGEKGQCISPR